MTDFTRMTGALEVVVDAVSILMSWRTVPSFRARVLHRLGDDVEREYQMEARPRALSYRLVEVGSGKADEFEGESRRLVSNSSELEYRIHMLAFEPLPVRLAFPMSLGIWGRATDGYRITGGTAEGSEIVLSLAHVQQGDLQGSLIIDRARRMAIRLDTPTEACRYERVEPI
jgi:hypothetical protein